MHFKFGIKIHRQVGARSTIHRRLKFAVKDDRRTRKVAFFDKTAADSRK
jgi:hypothetical protein